MTIFRTLLVFVAASLSLYISVQGAHPACDFSRYKPLVVDHPLVNSDTAIKKVEPKYPAMGKGMRAQGEVKVKILVDRKGKVVGACPTEGHPLLLASATSAAMQWRFLPNFGLAAKQRKKYIETVLVFKFVLN